MVYGRHSRSSSGVEVVGWFGAAERCGGSLMQVGGGWVQLIRSRAPNHRETRQGGEGGGRGEGVGELGRDGKLILHKHC